MNADLILVTGICRVFFNVLIILFENFWHKINSISGSMVTFHIYIIITAYLNETIQKFKFQRKETQKYVIAEPLIWPF